MKLPACAIFLLLLFASNTHAQYASRSRAGKIPAPANDALAVSSDSSGPIPNHPPPQTRMSPLAEVSLHQLLIPAKALKEFQRSEKSLQSGDLRSASEHLEKAIRTYPNFLEARNNLGAVYIDLKQYDKALAELQQAAVLDPSYAEPYNNLGLALFLLRRLPEAELAARHALELNPRASSTLYNLGRILAVRNENTLEAVAALRQAAPDYPDARLALALVFSKRGAVDQATVELREYLKDPDPDKKQRVEVWLAQLTEEQTKRDVIARGSNSFFFTAIAP